MSERVTATAQLHDHADGGRAAAPSTAAGDENIRTPEDDVVMIGASGIDAPPQVPVDDGVLVLEDDDEDVEVLVELELLVAEEELEADEELDAEDVSEPDAVNDVDPENELHPQHWGSQRKYPT